MTPRPPYVHPSALSPSEHEAYAAWANELDAQIARLGRGLRIGELLAFVRKRSPVDRETEIMSFFGSTTLQQSLGIGEFIAILRLLAHARTCSTLTRDHIFIQTHPLVLNATPSQSANPFSKPAASAAGLPLGLGNHHSSTNATSIDAHLREAAAKKKKVQPPVPASKAGSSSDISPITPKAGFNPVRAQPTPESPAHIVRDADPSQSLALPPTPPESTITAKSPPLPPRRPSVPQQPPPKHFSQMYRKIDDGTQTPTVIKPLHVPALGPTSLDIISSSIVQANITGQSDASSTTAKKQAGLKSLSQQASTSKRSQEATVRLLGSSHIGVNAKPLRATPATSIRHSSSSEEFTLHKNTSDSSLSSLTGVQPRGRRDPLSSYGHASRTDDGDLRSIEHIDEEDDDIATTSSSAKRAVPGKKPPLPPPPRRRPESLYVGGSNAAGHPSPFLAAVAGNIRTSPSKHRTNSASHASHNRSASLSSPSYSHRSSERRPDSRLSEGLNRANTSSSKPLDNLLAKGRDVSQEWLVKARAGMHAAHAGSHREDRQGLIAADEVTYEARQAHEADDASASGDELEENKPTVQDRRRELERIRTEGEEGWARLD